MPTHIQFNSKYKAKNALAVLLLGIALPMPAGAQTTAATPQQQTRICAALQSRLPASIYQSFCGTNPTHTIGLLPRTSAAAVTPQATPPAAIAAGPTYPQECLAATNARRVDEFGAFVAQDTRPAVIAANAATVNAAIETLGATGGGTICLPEGRYTLGFKTGFPSNANMTAAIMIARDNITLWGAGPGRTVLLTPPEYKVVNGKVLRGRGIHVQGTRSATAPRVNITLKRFELDGQAGWTGRYYFPADTATGDGWDITHKGIVPSQDTQVDNVVLEDIHVHRYRGEVIYVGGLGMKRLHVNRVKSEDTNASTYNATADAIVENSEFGLSRFWIEIGTAFQGKSGIFRNNIFHSARSGQGIALAQGDGLNQPYTFTNNRFSDCVGVFGFYGGVGGPIRIADNTASNCPTGSFVQFGTAPNTVVAGLRINKNIVVERNTIEGFGKFAQLGGQIDNMLMQFNTFRAAAFASSASVIYGAAGNYKNIRILNNAFSDTRYPTLNAQVFVGTRPLFAGNTYNLSNGFTGSNVVQVDKIAQPVFEQFRIHAGQANVTATLATNQYPDGQVIKVTGGTPSARVVFAAGGQNGYSVPANRTFSGTQVMELRYNAASKIWNEISFTETGVTAAR